MSSSSSKKPNNQGSGSNLKMPDLDFGGFGDDGDGDEDDEAANGLPADIFGVNAPAPAPSSVDEGPVEPKPPLVPHQTAEASGPSFQSPAEEQREAPLAPQARTEIQAAGVPAETPHAPTVVDHRDGEPPTAYMNDTARPTAQSPVTEPSSNHSAPEASRPVEPPSSSATVARRQSTHSVAGWGASTGLPARRPRRNSSKAFTADQRQENREQSMRELYEKAPRYASLLRTYSVVKKTAPKPRNIQLYGLAFERTATQIAIDTAVISRITPRMPTPRLIAGHYVDTALQGALSELNPEEADAERIEDEKDVVFKLAERAIAYRDYVADDEYASQLKHTRTICPLTQFGDALLTRLMTLLRTMPALKVQPFEIVSVAVSDLLDGMGQEQEAFEGFLARSVETTIQ